MKCVYHRADLDGRCSGAIVKHRYPECELIGYDYGDEFPWDRIEPRELIYMVDVSLAAQDMARLNDLAELVWIDHHASAIKSVQAFGTTIAGVQCVGLAACEITWGWCFKPVPIPRVVRLLGRYDVWDKRDPDAEACNFGMKVLDMDPAEGLDRGLWPDLFKDHAPDVDEIIETGRMILAYKRNGDASKAKNAFETTFGGLPVVALNGHGNSDSFRTVYDPKRHAAMLMFYMRHDGRWRVSLYSDQENVDCAAICAQHGGGGHKGAAGFLCDMVPVVTPFCSNAHAEGSGASPDTLRRDVGGAE